MASRRLFYDTAINEFLHVFLSDGNNEIFADDMDNDGEYINDSNSESSESGESDNDVDMSMEESIDEWTTTDKLPDIDIFCGDTGITEVLELDKDNTILDFFSFFIDSNLLNSFKVQTNLFAQQKLRLLKSTNKLTPSSRMSHWKAVTILEIKKFLAIIFHMSIDRKPQLADHWSQNPVVSCNYCPNIMRRDRFLLIMSNFHINATAIPKDQPDHDPVHEVRPLLQTLQEKFQKAYLPGEDVTIDEGMCKFRGRLHFKNDNPNKASKYDLKLYMVSECNSGYIWNFSVYCSASSTVTELCKNLLGSLANQGRTVFTDRFCASPTLAEELQNIKTGLVGATIKNRKGLPAVLKEKKRLERGQQVYRRKGNILALRWKDKRDIYMISTRHTADMIKYNDRFGRVLTKPACVVSYNKNKFGVDLNDQRVSYGAFEHRSVKWWRKFVFHALLMTILNASILYGKVMGKEISTCQFIRQLCLQLVVCENDTPRPSTSSTQLTRLSTGKHFLEKIPVPQGKKRCQRMCKVCSEKGSKAMGKATRKDTSYQCCECKVSLCKEPCFKIYHSKKNYKS